MIIDTEYIKPNITIETELIGAQKLYVYNYQGVHYRVFHSLLRLRDFITKESKTWNFECSNESQLEQYLENLI